MTFVTPNASEREIFEYIFNVSAVPGDTKLHLFTAPTGSGDIDEDTVLGDLTEVVDGSYAIATLANGSFTISTTDGVTSATYPQVTFTLAGTHDIYGWYITDNSNAALLFIERFAFAPAKIIGGGTILVDIDITLD